MAILALSVAEDKNCLPIKIDHRASLLISSVAPFSVGLGFFETYVNILLNLASSFMPNLRIPLIKGTTLGEPVDIHDDYTCRALWDAVERGDKLAVEEMVESDPPLLRISHLGRMLIHHAASLDQIEIVKFLLKRDPESLHAKTSLQHTPLHVAVGCQATECVTYLLDSGAKLNVKNVFGATPLQHVQGNYIWCLINPSWEVDRYQQIIQLLRARNPTMEDFLSQPAVSKALGDWIMVNIYWGLLIVTFILALAVALRRCYKGFVKEGILQVLLDWTGFAIRLAGSTKVRPVETYLALPSGVIFDVIYTSILVPHNFWFLVVFEILVLELGRLRYYLATSQEERAWLSWAARRSRPNFDQNNPSHWKELFGWGKFKPDKNRERLE